MLSLPDSWVWDFWTADDGERYHLFFLFASRALGDPDARHLRASVGHAVSDDLVHWERVADALVRSDPPAFDDIATWTGSVVRHPDGTWFCFYTGTTRGPLGVDQAIGAATSDDLFTWHKLPGPLVVPDGRWYEVPADGGGAWQDQTCRDPWVLPDPAGDGWHMLYTARAKTGAINARGVVGHAWSPDLRRWESGPPLSESDQGFGQLEVVQPVVVDGQHFLVFSCADPELAPRSAPGTGGGIWAARSPGPLGPWDIADAQQLTDTSRYVGKVVTPRDGSGRDGSALFLAFHDRGPDGFVGSIADPVGIRAVDGRLVLG